MPDHSNYLAVLPAELHAATVRGQPERADALAGTVIRPPGDRRGDPRRARAELRRRQGRRLHPAARPRRPAAFGIAVATLDGPSTPPATRPRPFSIQSISKVFLLTLALGRLGESLWTHVGREPSGTAFNSIVQLEAEHGRPRNPFINAGAIVVTDLVLAGHSPREAIGEILRFMRFLADDDTIAIDAEVARSELATGDRNYALAHFMRSFGRLAHPVDKVLGVYFHHCAIAMSCRQLARAGLFLAAGGRSPITGNSVVSPARARRINAVMLTCGHYDASGDFAYRVGLPGKSGVGGGILAIAPGHAADRRLVAGPRRQRQLAPRRPRARDAGPAHRLVGVRRLTAPGRPGGVSCACSPPRRWRAARSSR